MVTLLGVILLSVLASFSKADFCQDNFTLAELPKGLLAEAFSIITTGIINDFKGCPESVTIDEDEVKLWLFTRNNTDTPILLDKNNVTQLDASKPIKVLIPGWLCNVTNDRMPPLKDAYLKAYDCYVIGVDWTKYSIDLYTKSFCFIPKIAKVIGKFLCSLQGLNIDLSKLHVLGHSMGGQTSGFVGQEVQKQCQKKLGRITGLDPAGPLYYGLDESRRLSADDAELVDVIHTNQKYLGYYGDCGKVDFYPNCGTYQPDCLEITNKTTIKDIINIPTTDVGCNHLRSLDYMIESISSDKFISKSCKVCASSPLVDVCKKDFWFPSTTIMGENTKPNPSDNKYYLQTNGKPPYAKG